MMTVVAIELLPTETFADEKELQLAVVVQVEGYQDLIIPVHAVLHRDVTN